MTLGLPGPVLIIGSGLIGGSIGLALSAAGEHVLVSDSSPGTERLAHEMGVGEPFDGTEEEPALVIVAAPPDVAGALVAQALARFPRAVVTDVASVKQSVLDDVAAHAVPDHLPRYAGAHPMAGREVAGVIGARGDLFRARTFVVVPHESSEERAIDAVARLGAALGSTVVQMGPQEHDLAVAHVSHLPQMVSSLLAASLLSAPEDALDLAGQGLRDTTRIAQSDPRLWVEILGGNAATLAPLVSRLRERLADLERALDGEPDRLPLGRLIADGNAGTARIPGKHGGSREKFASVTILVPDAPGELGRLLSDMGAIDVNLEDLRLEHGSGSRVGLAHIAVAHDTLDRLHERLPARGWTIVEG